MKKRVSVEPLEPFDAKPPHMFGPRHIAYHPDLPYVYFSNEQQLGVSAYRIEKTVSLWLSSMPQRFPVDHPIRQVYEACMQVILL
jgi:6-phosphogluconolactonase (cycloisomerase 2 family)